MARFRRRRSGRTGATGFAPSEDRKGKSLTWESIIDEPEPQAIQAMIPNDVRVVGQVQTRQFTLIPANVTRGVVTLERIRGFIEVYFDSAELASALENWFVHLMITLTPVRDGDIDLTSVLSPGNQADQENNRILWQRLYSPRAGTTITAPGALEKHESNFVGQEVDVKSKRRFARDSWGLSLVMDCNVAAESLHLGAASLRGLFRAGDGL